MTRALLALVASFLTLLPGAFSFAAADPPKVGRPAPGAEVGIDQNLNAQLPLDLEFADETGHVTPLRRYFGHQPVVFCLVYYECPMLCNQVLNALTESLRAIDFTPGKDYQLVVISFDPRETPHLAAVKKKNYVIRYTRPGADVGWHFLTGNEANIKAVSEAAGFRYRWDAERGQFAHASGIMVATPEGKLSRYFYGIDYPTRDLRLGLVEASANKIGSPVDQFLLLCLHYDPLTGKYGMAISAVLRVSGGLTVFALGLFMFITLRRERRQSRRATSPADAGAPHRQVAT